MHRIARAAEAPGTWQDAPVEPVPADAVRSAFRVLHREVCAARLVRGAWTLAAGGSGALAALTVGTDLLEAVLGQVLA